MDKHRIRQAYSNGRTFQRYYPIGASPESWLAAYTTIHMKRVIQAMRAIMLTPTTRQS